MQNIIINTPEHHKKALTPSKIVCIGRNYVAHIQELNNEMPEEPVIFVKPNSAIYGHLSTHATDQIHFEAELTFVIENNTLYAVGVGLDLTKREVQNQLKDKGLPWERSKAFDKSAVFSDFVSTEGLDIAQLGLKLFINDVLVQSGDVSLMLYKPCDIIENVASFMTFNDGDLLMTGTPSGVGKVFKNDLFLAQVIYKDSVLLSAKWQAM